MNPINFLMHGCLSLICLATLLTPISNKKIKKVARDSSWDPGFDYDSHNSSHHHYDCNGDE